MSQHCFGVFLKTNIRISFLTFLHVPKPLEGDMDWVLISRSPLTLLPDNPDFSQSRQMHKHVIVDTMKSQIHNVCFLSKISENTFIEIQIHTHSPCWGKADLGSNSEDSKVASWVSKLWTLVQFLVLPFETEVSYWPQVPFASLPWSLPVY